MNETYRPRKRHNEKERLSPRPICVYLEKPDHDLALFPFHAFVLGEEMRIVITCGPAYEPIDQVRRITNASTGELGTLLAETFAEAGHAVSCFRAAGSTFAPALWPVQTILFTTNDDLELKLTRLLARETVQIVFHAAALGDFRVAGVTDEAGREVEVQKISSRIGPLILKLEPAPKVIARLRSLFPASLIVGWKYEMVGEPEEVLAKGRRQIDECLTDACVLNGKAYGTGFGMITREGKRVHLPDKAALCRFLLEWSEQVPGIVQGPESFHALSSFIPLAPFI